MLKPNIREILPNNNEQENNSSGTKRRHATLREQITIRDLLLRYSVNVDGYCVYEEGWSDKRIAESTGPHINENQVARIRRELGFGKMHLAATAHTTELHQQIVDLRGALANYAPRAALNTLVEKIEKIEARMKTLESLITPK